MRATTRRISTLAAMAAVATVGTVAYLPGQLFESQEERTAPLVRVEGPAVRIGNGSARTYVLVDPSQNQMPREIGVAIDAAGLEGLPTSGMVMNRLQLPQNAPAPYKFVMFDWNSMGHEPPGIYDHPHFDFHFYFTPEAEVDRIVPANAAFANEANALPAADFIPPMYAALAPPGAEPAAIAVPQMGVHWSDVRSSELQGLLGKPESFQPFTKTFIFGSWNGRFTFIEPMITRAYLLTRPNEIIPIPQPTKFETAGWYPEAYRIVFDEPANEYRIALTNLTWHDGEE